MVVVGWVRHGGGDDVRVGGSLLGGLECFAGSFTTGLVSCFERVGGGRLLIEGVVVWRAAEQLGRGSVVGLRGSVSLAHVFA